MQTSQSQTFMTSRDGSAVFAISILRATMFYNTSVNVICCRPTFPIHRNVANMMLIISIGNFLLSGDIPDNI